MIPNISIVNQRIHVVPVSRDHASEHEAGSSDPW
jgi:hypothetical protein